MAFQKTKQPAKPVTADEALAKLQAELYEIWPELHSEWAPLTVDLVTSRSNEFVDTVQKLPDYVTWRYAEKRKEELTKAALQAERNKAQGERLQAHLFRFNNSPATTA